MDKYIKALIAFLCLPLACAAAFAAPIDSYSKAKVVFPITSISINGRTATFTITRNARTLKKQAEKSAFFALKKVNTPPSSECPVTNTSDINKTVKNYNFLTGKATISVDFADATMAKKAMSKDCLLIINSKLF